MTVLLLKLMQRLKAHVQYAWTIKFGKISQYELWFSHGGGQGFLGKERSVHMKSSRIFTLHEFHNVSSSRGIHLQRQFSWASSLV